MKLEEMFSGFKTKTLFVKEHRRSKAETSLKSADDRENEIRILKPLFKFRGKKGFLYKILGRFKKNNCESFHFPVLCLIGYKQTNRPPNHFHTFTN